MKNFFTLFLAVLVLILCATVLFACADDDCIHSYGDYTVKKDATCAEVGIKERTCLICGSTDSKEIEKISHKYGNYTSDNNKTCTSPGTLSASCTVCGDVTSKSVDELAVGHVYENGICAVCEDEMELLDVFAASDTVSVKVYKSKDGQTVLDVVGEGAMNDLTVDVEPAWNKYKRDVTELHVYEGVTRIGAYAFSDFDAISYVYLEKGVRSVGACAFRADFTPSRVYINDVATWVELEFEESGIPSLYLTNFLFMGGDVIKGLEIPEGVEKINPYAFYKNSMLLSVSLPESLRSIGKRAFSGCGAIEEVHIKSLSAWCGVEIDKDGANPLINGKDLYVNDVYIAALVIPEGVEKISSSAFDGCQSIKSVTLPTTLKEIGNMAFYNCTSLENVDFGGTERIGEFAFYNCLALAEISLPATVTTVSADAFRACSAIKKITLFSGISLGDNALEDVNTLEAVEFYGTEGELLALMPWLDEKVTVTYK